MITWSHIVMHEVKCKNMILNWGKFILFLSNCSGIKNFLIFRQRPLHGSFCKILFVTYLLLGKIILGLQHFLEYISYIYRIIERIAACRERERGILPDNCYLLDTGEQQLHVIRSNYQELPFLPQSNHLDDSVLCAVKQNGKPALYILAHRFPPLLLISASSSHLFSTH